MNSGPSSNKCAKTKSFSFLRSLLAECRGSVSTVLVGLGLSQQADHFNVAVACPPIIQRKPHLRWYLDISALAISDRSALARCSAASLSARS